MYNTVLTSFLFIPNLMRIPWEMHLSPFSIINEDLFYMHKNAVISLSFPDD